MEELKKSGYFKVECTTCMGSGPNDQKNSSRCNICQKTPGDDIKK
jgi:hypothetical protein